jgi:HK97 family phage portal protein
MRNTFNEAFYKLIGGGFTNYDDKGHVYLDKGYNINPFVYSIIDQQARKTASIPYSIRRIEDKSSKRKLEALLKVTKNDLTPQQQVKKLILENKAYSDELLNMPLDQPNALQTWTEFLALYKTFLATNGNVYLFMLSPNNGPNKGTPQSFYILPSQDIQIILKHGADMLGTESPIHSYMLIQGNSFIEFPADKVIHIKTSNPNFDMNGSHLYGQSRLRAALRNIQSSNKGLDLNIKTLQSGGAFGFIHAKGSPLQPEQASEIKERLKEMNSNPEDLAKIAGISSEIGFTRLSLTSAELQPFEYLNFDQKQIANVLGWSDKLLNNDGAATMNNIDNERKRVITDNIHPDLLLLQDALNKKFLPLFKGFENTELVFDISELPEMQQDIKEMATWAVSLLDKGALTRNEVRDILTFAKVDNDDMDEYTVIDNPIKLSESLDDTFSIDNSNNQ